MSTLPLTEPDVVDSRRGPRFLLDPPIRGTFDDVEIDIYNIGENGLQAEFREKMMRGRFGEVRFTLPISPRVIRLQGRITWCRQAIKRQSLAWPYRCGIKVEHIHALTIDALAELLRRKLVRPDRNSLERKRKLLMQRQLESVDTASASSIGRLPAPLTMDECITRVQNGRAVLRGNPELASRALAEARRRWRGSPEPDELLAIWQYLGGAVDPALISVVLDLYPDTQL